MSGECACCALHAATRYETANITLQQSAYYCSYLLTPRRTLPTITRAGTRQKSRDMDLANNLVGVVWGLRGAVQSMNDSALRLGSAAIR